MPVRRLRVGEDESGLRLDRWLRIHFPGIPYGHLAKLLRTGQIRVDGARVGPDRRLEAGETVRLPPLREGEDPEPGRPTAVGRGEAGFLAGRVLHLDDSLLAIDKPAGLAVQGGTGLSRSLDMLAGALVPEGSELPRLVHRLDRDTSGVLLLGRTRRAAAELAAAFRSRQVRKTYWAAVHGCPQPSSGVLAGGIARAKEGTVRRMRVTSNAEVHGSSEARYARTEYRTVGRAGAIASWVALWPETGRTHQIRAQLAEAGAPIIGDRRYGSAKSRPESEFGEGFHLHARAIEVRHPDGGGILRLEAPLPEHMSRTWDLFGWDPKAVSDKPLEVQ